MKYIKPSINVEYIVEWNNGGVWEELKSFTRLDEATEYIRLQRESVPDYEFRFIRTEWQVID